MEKRALNWWTQGAFIGGIIGGTIGGVIGIVTGPGAVGLAGLGVTLGMSIGAGLSLQADLQKVIDPQTVIDEVEMASVHGCCVDFDNEVYPVGWMPYIGDWGVKGGGMRSYDPTTIPGVGILVRVDTAPDGHKQLIGKQLMTGGEEVLVDQGPEGHYSWVFHPSQAIIYKWNSGDAIKAGNYIRHSQIAGGKPVLCAGEWTLEQGQIGIMIATINDSSGHYRPDGGMCLGPVLTKLQHLGVDVDAIKVTTS